MGRSGFALLALPLLCSCGSTETADDSAVVDSAGITIVTNSSGRLSTAPHWSLVEDSVLTLGLRSEDAPVFFRVADILPLPGGRVAVLNSGAFEVLILDEAGALVDRWGGEGDGPGEFRDPNALVLLSPDSVGVYDQSQDRLSVFDGNGALARVATFEDIPRTGGYERALPLSDGNLVLYTWGAFTTERSPGIFRAAAECIRVSNTGQKTGSYGEFPGPEMYIDGGKMGFPFFSADTYMAASGGVLIVGTAEETEWRGFGPDGALTMIARWPDHERTITQDRVDSLVEVVASQLFPEQRTQVREVLSERPWSPRAPAYQDILASDGGDVWVGDYPDPTAGYLEQPPTARRWLVFRVSGELEATIETPTGFRPFALVPDAVLGVFRDELGVETPRRYRVVKG